MGQSINFRNRKLFEYLPEFSVTCGEFLMHVATGLNGATGLKSV